MTDYREIFPVIQGKRNHNTCDARLYSRSEIVGYLGGRGQPQKTDTFIMLSLPACLLNFPKGTLFNRARSVRLYAYIRFGGVGRAWGKFVMRLNK